MAATTAGLLSTAVLLVPGCDRPPPPKRETPDPVRRATYKSFVARDFLASCEAPQRGEMVREQRHFDELRALASEKGLGRSLWLGENDWNAVARVADHKRCGRGAAAYEAALEDFESALGGLATAIAEHRE